MRDAWKVVSSRMETRPCWTARCGERDGQCGAEKEGELEQRKAVRLTGPFLQRYRPTLHGLYPRNRGISVGGDVSVTIGGERRENGNGKVTRKERVKGKKGKGKSKEDGKKAPEKRQEIDNKNPHYTNSHQPQQHTPPPNTPSY
jgi:hypothetical protein